MKDEIKKIIEDSYQTHIANMRISSALKFFSRKAIKYQIIYDNSFLNKYKYNRWLGYALKNIEILSNNSKDIELLYFNIRLSVDEIQREIIDSDNFLQHSYFTMLSDNEITNLELHYILNLTFHGNY